VRTLLVVPVILFMLQIKSYSVISHK